ncbi:MAG: hypothetical protein J0M26_17940 [Planctomycetes bacterium]|nr:hypothetical protein [Planctomycetota bacterium]
MEPKNQSKPKPLWWKFIQWGITLAILVGLVQVVRRAVSELYDQQAVLDRQIADLTLETTSAPAEQQAELQQQIDKLQQQRRNYWRVEPIPLLIAIGCYAITMTTIGYYWYRTLHFFQQPVPYWPTHRIFMFGQLAKYVPGKALVLVVRVGMLRPYGGEIIPCTVSVFMETLGTIGIAAALSGSFFLIYKPEPRMAWLALAAFLVAIAPTIPPIFNVALRFLLRKKLTQHEQTGIRPLNWSHFFFGWYTLGPALCLTGLALFFTLKALPATNLADNWSLLLIIGCIGTSCLAAVLGFVSFMPGGAGVRELVLMLSLEPLIGGPMALAVAIWYRLVTLGAELFLAAIAALFPPKPPQKGLSATPAVPNDDKVD